MSTIILLLWLQAAGGQGPVPELIVEADGRSWGAFETLARGEDGSATVTLADGWLDPGFLALWWPEAGAGDGTLAPGRHDFDTADCRGLRVDVRPAPDRRRLSLTRSWTLLGACVIAVDVAGPLESGRLPVKSLTFRVEDVGAAM